MSTQQQSIENWAATLNNGNAVSFGFSKGKTVLLLVASVIFVLVGLAMGLGGSLIWAIVGWVAVVFFLWGIVVMIRRLFAGRPALTVTPAGVEMKTAKAGLIPWSQILDIHGAKQNSNVFIEFDITDAEADRQSAAGLGVAQMTDDEGHSRKVLWAPNGLAANKAALCLWLEEERQARAAA